MFGRSLLLCFASLLLLGATGQVAALGFLVVVHAENRATSVSREELSRLFLKRSSKWPSGTRVAPVDLSPKHAARGAFTREVHGKSVDAVRAFWQQQIFSGRDVPPAEKSNDREVLAFVQQHSGAVGYVSMGTPLPPGVKTITIEGITR